MNPFGQNIPVICLHLEDTTNRLNRPLIDEVRELEAAVAQIRGRVAKSAKISVAAQEKRSNMSVDLIV